MNERADVEFFHLLFVRNLFVRGWTGRYEYALKGGASMRFFFGSPRYSEDIDLDAFIPCRTVLANVRGVLASRPLVERLLRAGLRMETSEPKQTETTQRWKVTLIDDESGRAIPTKVEISRRNEAVDENIVREHVDRVLLDRYHVAGINVPHYVAGAALAQKANALATRTVSQARDVFDMAWLDVEVGAKILPIDEATRSHAIDRLLGLSFRDYSAQMIPYLEPDLRDQHSSEEAWNAMQMRVLDLLGGSGPGAAGGAL